MKADAEICRGQELGIVFRLQPDSEESHVAPVGLGDEVAVVVPEGSAAADDAEKVWQRPASGLAFLLVHRQRVEQHGEVFLLGPRRAAFKDQGRCHRVGGIFSKSNLLDIRTLFIENRFHERSQYGDLSETYALVLFSAN